MRETRVPRRHPRRHTRWWAAGGVGVAVGVGATSAGCGSLACDDVGCAEVVEILVTGRDTFDVTMEAPGRPAEVLSCPEMCWTTTEGTSVLFGGTPRTLALVFRDPAGEEITRRTVRPTYRETRPNGPSCPPTCRTGSAAIDLPPTA